MLAPLDATSAYRPTNASVNSFPNEYRITRKYQYFQVAHVLLEDAILQLKLQKPEG